MFYCLSFSVCKVASISYCFPVIGFNTNLCTIPSASSVASQRWQPAAFACCLVEPTEHAAHPAVRKRLAWGALWLMVVFGHEGSAAASSFQAFAECLFPYNPLVTNKVAFQHLCSIDWLRMQSMQQSGQLLTVGDRGFCHWIALNSIQSDLYRVQLVFQKPHSRSVLAVLWRLLLCDKVSAILPSSKNP